MNWICWPHGKIQDGREYFHNLLSFKCFHICAKNKKINEWNKLLSGSLKENSSWKLFCYQNYLENATDFQS